MKRMTNVALLVLLLALALRAPALAETQTDLEDGKGAGYRYEDFAGALPESLREAFAPLMTAEDEVLCGTMLEDCRGTEDEPWWIRAMAAVRRGDRVLLMGAFWQDGVWKSAIESDRFLRLDMDFSMTIRQEDSTPEMAIELERGTFLIAMTSSGALSVEEYEPCGGEWVLNCFGKWWVTDAQGEMTEVDGVPPYRLAAWSADEFPTALADVGAWAAPYSIGLGADEAYISGVNLREEPTGASKSWGICSAKVQVLGSVPGQQASWVHVQLGSLDGWVSGNYVIRAEDTRDVRLYGGATLVTNVALVRQETTLLQRPDGGAVTQVAAGTLLHVLCESDGWLYVILPREALTSRTDWDGTYGFIRAEEAVVGSCAADVLYRP